MAIYVEKDGERLGPYSDESLWNALSGGELSGSDAAWIEGRTSRSTVGELVSKPKSNKLRAPATSAAIGTPTNQPGSAPAVAGMPIKTPPPVFDDSDEPDQFPIERLRHIGTATPLVILLVMLVPWAIDTRLFGWDSINGYQMFSIMTFPALLFAVAAGGIGLYGFEGACDGGIKAPLLALGCSFFAICTLAYLTVYRTRSNLTEDFESGLIELRGGWHFTMATILIGTAGAVFPSSEFELNPKIVSWIVSALFAIGGLTFLVLGFKVS